MISQAYNRYKAYLNGLLHEIMPGRRLNAIGVTSVTLTVILLVIISWCQAIYFMLEWMAGYIIV